MKKLMVTLVILALAAGAVFYSGWVQFSVPAGKYGVLVSKTSGVNPKPVIPAQFRWQWERLIPTNSTLYSFDLAPLSRTVIASGVLPSGEIYRSMLEGSPDFSWKLEMSVTARIEPDALPGLVDTRSIHDQAALDQLAQARITSLADATGRAIVADFAQNPAKYRGTDTDPATLSSLLKNSVTGGNTDGLELIDLTVTSVTLPDFTLYDLAAKTFADYQARRTTLMTEAAASQARDSVSDYLEMERFASLGEVLTKYPILIDYLAVTRNDGGEAFKSIKGAH